MDCHARCPARKIDSRRHAGGTSGNRAMELRSRSTCDRLLQQLVDVFGKFAVDRIAGARPPGNAAAEKKSIRLAARSGNRGDRWGRSAIGNARIVVVVSAVSRLDSLVNHQPARTDCAGIVCDPDCARRPFYPSSKAQRRFLRSQRRFDRVATEGLA